jgi:hypothetical protein
VSINDPDDPIAAATANLTRVIGEAAAITEELAASSAGLVPVHQDATIVKARLGDLRALAVRKQTEIAEAQTELRRALDRQLSAASAALEPMKKVVARLTEGIHAVNLYLGRDEEIVELRTGDRAPAGTPIVVRQMVLSMDQECAIAATDGGIDYRDIETFDAWLISDPAHIEQVIPEPKAVVAIIPRITDRDYGDPWANMNASAQNEHTYFLIRNGDTIFRTTTDFRVGTRLIPGRDEFTSMFVERQFDHKTHEYRTVPMEPGSSAWFKAEEAADARRRHYMKVALVLQGLIDRTTVFHPLPAAEVSLLHPESYDAGHVVVVTDGDLALGTGRPSFREWLKALNAQLRPGMRIIGAFNGEDWRNADESLDRRWGHSRLSPNGAAAPGSNVIHTLDKRGPRGSLTFKFERTDRRYGYEHGTWGRWGEWAYEKRASCTVFPTDRFIIAVDAVDEADVRYYLQARTERHEYMTMFPVLQAVLEVLESERQAEAPFRMMLAGELVKLGADVHEVDDSVERLVRWWKFANRHHRPLVGDADLNAKAVRMIVDEFRRQAKVSATSGSSVVDELVAGFPDAVFVGSRTDGSLVVFVPEDDGNVFVAEHCFTAKGVAREVKRWRLTGGRVAKLAVLWQSERWAAWDHSASMADHLSGPERDRLVDEACAQIEAATSADDVGDGGDGFLPSVLWVDIDVRDRRLEVWSWAADVDIPTDAPLTEGGSDVKVYRHRFGWSRGKGMVARLDGGSDRSHVVDGYWPWNTDPRGDRRGRVFVLRRDDALAAMDARRSVWAKHEDWVNGLRARVDRWERAVDALFVAGQEKAAYERFIEDFRDPGLWEGHRKGLRFDRVFTSRDEYGLRFAAKCLVERGVDVESMSPAEVVARWEELCAGMLGRYGSPVRLKVAEGVLLLPAPDALSMVEDDEDDM